MFRSKSTVEKVGEAASTQAHAAADKAADVKAVALDLIDKAAPHVAAARENAPQKVAEVADVIAPKVEKAKETFVDDVLPKVAEAVATIAAGAVSAKTVAEETATRAPDAFAVLKGESVAKKKRNRGKYLILGLLALGAAAVAYKKSTEKQDPWATAGAYTPPSAGRQSSVADKVATAADAAKEKVAGAADAVKDAVADKTGSKDETLSTAPGAAGAATTAPADALSDPLADPLDEPALGDAGADGGADAGADGGADAGADGGADAGADGGADGGADSPLGDQPTTTIRPNDPQV